MLSEPEENRNALSIIILDCEGTLLRVSGARAGHTFVGFVAGAVNSVMALLARSHRVKDGAPEPSWLENQPVKA